MANHASAPSKRPWWRRPAVLVISAGVTAAVAIATTLTVSTVTGHHETAVSVPKAASVTTSSLPTVTSLPLPQLVTLPDATYNAQPITGLIPVTTATIPRPVSSTTLTRMAPLYGQGAKTPVARLDTTNFTGAPTVIDIVKTSGPWALILTPTRQALPSTSLGHTAAAQTAAWVPRSYLKPATALTSTVTVSVDSQTLTIHQAHNPAQHFRVGVGTRTTPSPVGTTGYVQARFINPEDGTGNTQIQLTSLHSAVQDNPAGGEDQGLIAMHYYPANHGAISHGCIRLTAAALAAVSKLPIGTPVTITK